MTMIPSTAMPKAKGLERLSDDGATGCGLTTALSRCCAIPGQLLAWVALAVAFGVLAPALSAGQPAYSPQFVLDLSGPPVGSTAFSCPFSVELGDGGVMTCWAKVPGASTAGNSVLFRGDAQASTGESLPTFDWDFGDGAPHSASAEPTHAYAVPGLFAWTMRASARNAASCSKSGFIDVRAPTSLNMSFDGFQVGNLSTMASHIHLWFDMTSAEAGPIERDDYSFRVVSDTGRELARMVGFTASPKASTPGGTINRLGVELEVTARNTAGAPGFTGGRLEVSRTESGATTTEVLDQGDFDLSVWGTDFDMATDAYPFSNGRWAEGSGLSDDAINAARVVRSFLNAVGAVSFWQSVGWGPLTGSKGKSAGLCYGMASTAVARFVHRPSTDYWGEHCLAGEPYCKWESESDNSWRAAILARESELDGGVAPAKNSPLPTSDSLFSAAGTADRVELEAFKKILYYFVTQPLSWGGIGGDNEWVGDDKLADFSFSGATSLLESNRPALFTFQYDERWNIPYVGNVKKVGVFAPLHAIVLLQAARLNGSASLLFYDNLVPPMPGTGSAMLLATVRESNPRTLRGVRLLLQQKNGNTTPLYILNWAKLLRWDEGDSQWIYGAPRPAKATAAQPEQTMTTPGSRLDDPERQLLLERGYARVLAVGTEAFRVFPVGQTEPLEPVFRGELDGSTVVYDGGASSFTTTIYVPAPAGVDYTVEVSKGSTSPALMIYVDVPTSGDSLDAIGYENLEKAGNERTTATITVGRGNRELQATRVSANGVVDSVEPTFAELATLAVPAVSSLAATRDGVFVRLSWANPVHAGFDGVTVVRTTGSPATLISDGTVIYEGIATAASDSPTDDGAVYYTVFSMSEGTAASSSWVSILPTRPCIAGQVTASGKAVVGAVVAVVGESGRSVTTMTDSLGHYSVCDLSPDRYVITCEKTGVEFEPGSRTLLVDETSTQVDFDGTVIPTLSVTSPSGGERWAVGSTQYIGWTSTGDIESVDAELSRDGGVTWEMLEASTANDGTLLVNVSRPPSTECLVRVHATGATADAQSSSAFSIVEPARVHRKVPRK